MAIRSVIERPTDDVDRRPEHKRPDPAREDSLCCTVRRTRDREIPERPLVGRRNVGCLLAIRSEGAARRRSIKPVDEVPGVKAVRLADREDMVLMQHLRDLALPQGTPAQLSTSPPSVFSAEHRQPRSQVRKADSCDRVPLHFRIGSICWRSLPWSSSRRHARPASVGGSRFGTSCQTASSNTSPKRPRPGLT